MQRLRVLLKALLLSLAGTATAQQSLPSTLQRQALRSVNHHGAFRAAAYTPDGNLVLLYDQGDGPRLLKTDSTASTLLAQTHLGSAGDTGITLVLDPVGNLYLGGTSSSGALTGTAGAAFPNPVNNSINSFVAKFDSNLNLLFLTFLGAPNTALTGLAVTSNAVFTTGIIYSSTLPTTPTAVQSLPAANTNGNGFVQRLSPDGTTLVYSTYLTGADGSTTPTAITADAANHAFIAGSTASPNFPAINALEPVLLGASSGFLTELTPTGDAFLFSSFLAGSGISSLALDPSTGNLLLTGNLDPGLFPLANATSPLANTPYQSLLRLTPDGQELLDSTLLFPSAQSFLTPGPNSSLWLTANLAAPITAEQTAIGTGNSLLLHLTSADLPDVLLRFGGHPFDAPQYATLTAIPGPLALNASASAVAIPSTLSVATDPSLAAFQAFELGLTAPTTLLPSSPNDLLPTPCVSNSPCSGSAGLLTFLAPQTTGQTTLLLSSGDLPSLTLRNAGPAAATNLQLAATGATLASNCPTTLPANAQCGAWLTGAGPSTLTVTAANALTQTLSLPPLPTATTAQPLAVDTPELNFGIVTAAAPATRTLTVSNLSTLNQFFTSSPDNIPSSGPYTLAETASTCAGPANAHTLAANAACTVTLTLTASPDFANDSLVQAAWRIGTRDIPISAFTQAATLSLSSTRVDFGPSLASATNRLPRFLYLSNPSPVALAHATITAPPTSPFTLNDDCPSVLQPNSICQIGLLYTQTTGPSLDTLTLTLDLGLTVLVTGETLAATPSNTLPDSPLLVSPNPILFASAVPVSVLSTSMQVVTITNISTTATVPLTASVLGDFQVQNTCPSALPPQTSCDLGLTFAPSQPGLRDGLLSLSAGPAYSITTVPISGTATPLLTLGNALDLGETPIGEPLTTWYQVQGSFPQLTVAASGPGFGVALLQEDGNGHGTLPASAFAASATAQCSSCWIGLQFLPTATGPANGTLQLATDPNGTPNLTTLTALGLPDAGLLLTPAAQTFPATPVGSTSASLTFTLTNMLPSATPISLQSLTATGDFQLLSSASPQSCSTAQTLTPTAACSLTLAFTPTAFGSRTGTLTIATSAGTVTATLNATGAADPNPVPGLALSPTTLAFDRPSSQTLTLTNTSAATLAVATPTSSNAAFTVAATTCATLTPGQTCTATVAFQPTTTASTGNLTLHVTSPAAQTTYILPLTGPGTLTGTTLAVFPTAADFGPSPTSTLGQVRQFTLTNTASTNLTITLASSRNFPLAAPATCASLAPAATCTFAIAFFPETAGPLTGAVTLLAANPDGSPAGQTLIYLQGYGTSPAILTFSGGLDPQLPLNFGTVDSGQTASQTLALTNTSATPLTLRRLSTTPPFQLVANCTTTLAPAASCTATLTYAPAFQVSSTAAVPPRTDRGTLLLESDSSTSATTIYLAGAVRPSTQPAAPPAGTLPTYTLSASALTFPNTAPGAVSPTQTVTVTNTGTVPITFTAALAPPHFTATTTCATLAPTATCNLQVSFTPLANTAPALHADTLQLISDAATPLDFLSLLGSSFPAPLQLSTSALDFGPTLLGSSATAQFTVTNVSTLPVALGNFVLTGPFTLNTSACFAPGAMLPAGQSCTATLTYTPTALGPQTGTLTLNSPALNQPLQIALTGTGIAGQLTATTASLDFGTVLLNTASTLSLHFTDTGNAPLTGFTPTLAGSDASLFSITANTCLATLPVAVTCDLQLTFHPLLTGPASATLTLASSDPASPLTIPLTGAGSPPPGFTLTVNGSPNATIHSGDTAQFPLLVTPQGGYNTPVTLACAALNAAPNATCILSATQLAFTNGTPAATARLQTLSGLTPASPISWTWLLLLPIPLAIRRRKRFLSLATLALSTTLGCGPNYGIKGYPYTPPGTYTYQVTATSTTDTALSSTVTLTVIVH